ncbi:MAG: S-methyl-5-thioribose-1-phosphate isomerase [Bacilli bacterium]
MSIYHSLEWAGDHLRVLDQRVIPEKMEYLRATRYQDVIDAIGSMAVRGAPAIGIAAAYGLVLAAREYQTSAGNAQSSLTAMLEFLYNAAEELAEARPTAVNLQWAVKRMSSLWKQGAQNERHLYDALLAEADEMYREDIEVNKAIARHGESLVPAKAKVIHHCNTGALGTADYGTALGVIRYAHEEGKDIFVYVDETRPRLQGSRLTAWELRQLGVPYEIIVDGAAAYIMSTQGVDFCVVGCDRVAANGDVANKIGTYHLAIAARAHGVPFYVAAPTSTIDLSTPNGDAIHIEERPSSEVTKMAGVTIIPDDYPVRNPAFDVTPASHITAIITENGVATPPYEESLPKLMGKFR